MTPDAFAAWLAGAKRGDWTCYGVAEHATQLGAVATAASRAANHVYYTPRPTGSRGLVAHDGAALVTLVQRRVEGGFAYMARRL